MGGRKSKLPPKRQRFVLEYMRDMNGTAAAIRAGYSKRIAKEYAYKMLRDPRVQEELAARMDQVSKRIEMSVDDVVREYIKIARANITDFLSFDQNGVKLAPSSERTPEQLAAIAEVRMVTTEEGRKTMALKMHSKTDALFALGKHLGMFVDRHQVELDGKAEVRFYLPDNGRRPKQ